MFEVNLRPPCMMHTYYALLLLLLLLLLLAFTFAMCRRPTVCRLSSVTFVHPTQAIEIFGSVFTPFYALAIC